jgi:hypothetical protein
MELKISGSTSARGVSKKASRDVLAADVLAMSEIPLLPDIAPPLTQLLGPRHVCGAKFAGRIAPNRQSPPGRPPKRKRPPREAASFVQFAAITVPR